MGHQPADKLKILQTEIWTCLIDNGTNSSSQETQGFSHECGQPGRVLIGGRLSLWAYGLGGSVVPQRPGVRVVHINQLEVWAVYLLLKWPVQTM